MSGQTVASLQASVNRLKHELTTMKVDDQIPEAGQSVTIADYLLERLAQLKVTASLTIILVETRIDLHLLAAYVRSAGRLQSW